MASRAGEEVEAGEEEEIAWTFWRRAQAGAI